MSKFNCEILIPKNKKAFLVGCVLPACKLYVLQWPPPEVILEESPNDGHQMSLAGGPGLMSRWGPGLEVPGMTPGGAGAGGALYSDAQCIMGNGHMKAPPVNIKTDTSENITFP